MCYNVSTFIKRLRHQGLVNPNSISIPSNNTHLDWIRPVSVIFSLTREEQWFFNRIDQTNNHRVHRPLNSTRDPRIPLEVGCRSFFGPGSRNLNDTFVKTVVELTSTFVWEIQGPTLTSDQLWNWRRTLWNFSPGSIWDGSEGWVSLTYT